MVEFPLDPSLAKMLLVSAEMGCSDEVLVRTKDGQATVISNTLILEQSFRNMRLGKKCLQKPKRNYDQAKAQVSEISNSFRIILYT